MLIYKHFGHLGLSVHSSTSSLTQTTIQRRSAMKIPSSSSSNEKYPRKTVQWLIDTKKRPEDISQDRKVVKDQVKDDVIRWPILPIIRVNFMI